MIGAQALRAQRLAGLVAFCASHGQTLAYGGGGGVTQALGIGHGHQDQRAGAGRMAELIAMARTDQGDRPAADRAL